MGLGSGVSLLGLRAKQQPSPNPKNRYAFTKPTARAKGRGSRRTTQNVPKPGGSSRSSTSGTNDVAEENQEHLSNPLLPFVVRVCEKGNWEPIHNAMLDWREDVDGVAICENCIARTLTGAQLENIYKSSAQITPEPILDPHEVERCRLSHEAPRDVDAAARDPPLPQPAYKVLSADHGWDEKCNKHKLVIRCASVAEWD